LFVRSVTGGKSPLLDAAKQGKFDEVSKLLIQGEKPTVEDSLVFSSLPHARTLLFPVD
jgi:hypothetical protein